VGRIATWVRIPVNNHRFQQSAQIMLRPEQLQVADVIPTDGQGCRAVVTERDFSRQHLHPDRGVAGSQADEAARRSFLVRSSGMHAPPAGSAVQLSIHRPAHVFARPDQRSKRSTARRRSLSSRTS
jgi:iron(III) transport system ATP-binding protein